jgi:hypothetical protein
LQSKALKSSKVDFHEWIASLDDPDWLIEMQKKEALEGFDDRAFIKKNVDGKWKHVRQKVSYLEMEEAKRMKIQAVLVPLRELKLEMEKKWGIDRLPSLVSDELAARFASAASKLQEAEKAGEFKEIADRAEIMRRGWLKLDEAASSAGAEPFKYPDVFQGKRPDGKKFLVVQDSTHSAYVNQVTGFSVFCMDEIAGILQLFDEDGFITDLKQLGGNVKARTTEDDFD